MYGLTPTETAQLSVVEMADFVEAKNKMQLKQNEFIARVAYTAGVVASMALSKKRPKFEELFNFPKDDTITPDQIDKKKKELLRWALQVNRAYRKKQHKEASKDGK